MGKFRFLAPLMTLGLISAVGCQGRALRVEPGPSSQVVAELDAKIKSGEAVQRASNVEFIFDSSSSMDDDHRDSTKHKLAGKAFQAINRAMPNIPLKAAVRTYGGKYSTNTSDLRFGVADYNREGVQNSIEGIRAEGNSNLPHAIKAAAKDLEGLTGETALIVISDGMINSTLVMKEVEKLKEAVPGLCIHTVSVGNNAAGKALMEQMAAATECGSHTRRARLDDSKEAGKWVESVFLKAVARKCTNVPEVALDAEGCPLDTDGDGVYDTNDQCPGTPAGSVVNSVGCVEPVAAPAPADEDKDGVVDDADQCKGTPGGMVVDDIGCWRARNVYFDVASSKLDAAAVIILDEVAGVIKATNPSKVTLNGHTDNTGSAALNAKLSENRAKSAVDYLIKSGVAADRLVYAGHSFNKPAEDNSTYTGRKHNRRVEFELEFNK